MGGKGITNNQLRLIPIQVPIEYTCHDCRKFLKTNLGSLVVVVDETTRMQTERWEYYLRYNLIAYTCISCSSCNKMQESLVVISLKNLKVAAEFTAESILSEYFGYKFDDVKKPVQTD